MAARLTSDQAFDGCSVTSTTGGSMGYTDTTDMGSEPYCRNENSNRQALQGAAAVPGTGPGATTSASTMSHCAGYATVLVNGVQLIRCPIPEVGQLSTTEVEAEDVNISGEVGGMGLDILFMAAQGSAAEGHEWKATLVAKGDPLLRKQRPSICPAAEEPQAVHRINIGAVAQPGSSSHVGYYLQAVPHTFEVVISHLPVQPMAPTPAEHQLVKEVRSVLENPRLNKEGGSLSSVLLNNKAKDSVLYEKVVGRLYGGSWSEFLKAHGGELEIFYYKETEIKRKDLAPHIKRCDARVFLAGKPMAEVQEADRVRCDRQRQGEEEFKSFLIRALASGEVSQKELLADLKTCKGFTDSLFPTFSLLMRFLSRHSDTFVWASDPDQPTRIGLASKDRYPHHETPDVFIKVNQEDGGDNPCGSKRGPHHQHQLQYPRQQQQQQQQPQQHHRSAQLPPLPPRNVHSSTQHPRSEQAIPEGSSSSSSLQPPFYDEQQQQQQGTPPYQQYAATTYESSTAATGCYQTAYHRTCYRHDPYQEAGSFVYLPTPQVVS
eukprot:TRINITY_DN1526_c1_g1_i3.p1 TRINITY_DN1526_c1_g1~~TRINITY_DN1526_c1_g1_i3.p1  ORF type:complete len:562 (+),score=169.33 TRINITY_DN1526_c1_g1_i3:46-1686(+)